MDLSIAGDVYLCNEGGCGLRSSTPYTKVWIIKRQAELQSSQILPKVSLRDAALLKLLRYWGVLAEPSNILLQIVNRVAKKKDTT